MRILINCDSLDHLARDHVQCSMSLAELRLAQVRGWNQLSSTRPGVGALQARSEAVAGTMSSLGVRLQLQQLLLRLVTLRSRLADNGAGVGWQLTGRTVGLRPMGGGFIGSGFPNLAAFNPTSPLGAAGLANSAVAMATRLATQPLPGGFSLTGSGFPNLAAFNPTSPLGAAGLANSAVAMATRLATQPLPGGSGGSGGGAFLNLGRQNFENMVFKNTTTSIGLKTGNLGL